MADGAVVHVEGFRELQRAFRLADATLNRELRGRLRDAAEPVRADAEQLAVSSIPRIGLRWSRMRVGVTQKLVYVAPKERGVKTKGRVRFKRKNLAVLLSERVMDPAREHGEAGVVKAMEDLLHDVGKAWEHA